MLIWSGNEPWDIDWLARLEIISENTVEQDLDVEEVDFISQLQIEPLGSW